ncbi:MAG: VOC family protein [Clostridiales bacterium]|jgi:PhnB protein|nr:VOC family protein [Clostridiales bacterium]
MLTPYLVFHGECKEAIDFYREVFPCGEPKIMPYGDYMPEGSRTPTELLRSWIMHAEMTICGTNVWFADEADAVDKGNNVRISATVTSGKDAEGIWGTLCVGGKVTLPPMETFYSVFHAAVIDKFGVHWNIVAEESPNILLKML